MINIKGDAIVFHMYCERADDEVIAEEISEKTPTFRNIKMRNIVCRRAKTAVLLKGLPEMPLKDLYLRKYQLFQNEVLLDRLSRCHFFKRTT
ncbi:hypothetical protein ACFFHM_23110 [Halalkalibacter kiskunsagensis]|uniref:Uncharacterized protein n=1 Tax=Halalkalibacter kiskunsagensis TaxID=1548599 RepID=A0ABV6KNA6_9BACI